MAGKQNLKCMDDPRILELAEALKTLSDPNRLRIMCMLLKGERCVCEVEGELGVSQQLASHHLNVLKESGFLSLRKEGTSSYYSVDRGRLEIITRVFMTYLDYRKQGDSPEAGLVCCGQPGGSGQAPVSRAPKPKEAKR